MKQCIILKDLESEKPIATLEVKSFKTAKDSVEFDKEVQHNKKELLIKKDEERKDLMAVIHDLQKRIKVLELEAQYNRGELTEGEYQDELNSIE